MMKVHTDPNGPAQTVAKDRALPWFVRSAARQALEVDCVEALNGFRLLTKVFEARARRLIGTVPPDPIRYEPSNKEVA